MKRIILIMVLLLGGCTWFKRQPEVNTSPVTPDTKVEFDKRLLTECESVAELTSASDTVILQFTKEVLRKLSECAKAKNLQNQEVRKALNVK